MERICFKHIGPKTDDWLTPLELSRDYIHANITEIKDAMTCLRGDGLSNIQEKRAGNEVIWCLYVGSVDWFCQAAHLMSKDNIKEKTEDWLTPAELRSGGHVNADWPTTKYALKRCRAQMPEYIQPKICGKRVELCLMNTKAAMEKFYAKSGLGPVIVVEKKDNWLSSYDLTKYIGASAPTIRKKLEKYAEAKPDNVKCIKLNHQYRIQLRDDESVIKDFRVFCDTNQSKRVDAPDKQTYDWLSAIQLIKQNLVTGTYYHLYKALEQYQSEMPDYIQWGKNKHGHPALYLRSDAIDMFIAKISSNQTVAETNTDTNILSEQSTDVAENDGYDWLSAGDLTQRKLVVGSYPFIHNVLQKYQSEMPEYIQWRKGNSRRAALCLRGDAVDIFNAKIQSDKQKTKEEINKDWFTPKDLVDQKLVNGSLSYVYKALKEYRDETSEYVQIKRKYANKPALCLHRDGIEMFSKKIKFKSDKSEKDADKWLSALELSEQKLVAGAVKKISEKLKQYQSEMPEYIQLKQRGRRLILCLNRDGIGQFCELSKLKQKNNISETKKPVVTVEDPKPIKKVASPRKPKPRGVITRMPSLMETLGHVRGKSR